MTKEKALIIALKIIETCKQNEDNCPQCPFNFHGCIVSTGNEIPTDWEAASAVEALEIKNIKDCEPKWREK